MVGHVISNRFNSQNHMGQNVVSKSPSVNQKQSGKKNTETFEIQRINSIKQGDTIKVK